MSRQVVVALPSWVRRRLAVDVGAVLYFHRHRGGEVVVTAKEHRGAGQPGRRDLEEELTRTIAERDQYKQQALGLELGERRAVFAQGYEASLRQEIPLRSQLLLMREQLAEVLAYVRPPRRAHRAREAGPARRVDDAGSVDAYPSPSPPSSPSPIDGGADTSGAAPPGVPPQT
jgi:hypothetical protein